MPDRPVSSPVIDHRRALVADTRAWLPAGAFAITVNTLLLAVAAHFGLQTGHGGVLKLIHPWLAPLLDHSGVAHLWASMALPAPGSPAFKAGFHVLVGMLMAAVYAFGERFVHWRAWIKGLFYAVLVYLGFGEQRNGKPG